MKHVYRAYPASEKSGQAIGAILILSMILAQWLRHVPGLGGALLGVPMLCAAVQGIRLIPRRVVIGEDGVLVPGFWSRSFVRRAAIASIEQPNDKRLRIVQTDGSVCELGLMSAKSAAPLRADLARLAAEAGRAAAESTRPRQGAAFDALAARVAAWAKPPDGAANAAAAPAGVAYRSGDSPEQLWEIAADPDAPPLARVGAVHALGALDDDARARVRVLADASADPLTAGALDAAARGDVARMRAICATGTVSGLPRASANAGDSIAERHALLHPNRALLGVAWLSRLWFVAPAIALASHSEAVAYVTFMACAIGAMPWVAVRESDPLIGVVPGRVDVVDGFVVQHGEPVFEIATATSVYVHYRAGSRPVVRFEGRHGWPLLDVRLGSLNEARAFLRRLPLREDQRNARFGTMHPGAARFAALVIAAMAVAALKTHVLQPHVLAALGGLALSPARLRRVLTVERDGLLLRSVFKTRFIPWSDVATVERRKGAGVVVLASGERVPLRSIAGELTDMADDDLTETVMDRIAEMREAKAIRTRVADEPTLPADAAHDAAHDESVDEIPESEQQRRARTSMDER